MWSVIGLSKKNATFGRTKYQTEQVEIGNIVILLGKILLDLHLFELPGLDDCVILLRSGSSAKRRNITSTHAVLDLNRRYRGANTSER